MKILHINTHQHGGAARAAIRLHEGLCRAGEDSQMMFRSGRGGSRSQIYQQPKSFISRVKRRLRRDKIERDFCNYTSSRPNGLEIFSDDRTEYTEDIVKQRPIHDIVNLHWVTQFVDYKSFFRHINKPVVWTLHDMNPFTGGCHYADSCSQFQNCCGACPQLGSSDKHDLSRDIWERKSKSLAQKSFDLHIVTPSNWLKKQAKASTLFKDIPISVIPNSLDTHVFSPRNISGFKSSIGIPEDAKVVLFVADSLDNKRKGFSLLLQAIQGIQLQEDVYFLSIGGGKEGKQLPNHVHLGNIGNDALMSVVYSIADVFVIPSLEDNLPNTVLESMACGTPVIGFDLGGLPDMIHSKKTGLLVKPNSIEGLRESILSLLTHSSLALFMGKQCRALAKKEYDLYVQAKRYSDLYQSVLHQSTHQ